MRVKLDGRQHFRALALQTDGCYHVENKFRFGVLVRITRNRLSSVILGTLCLCLLGSASEGAEQIFAPDYLWSRHIGEKTDPVEVADTHLKIPYREDGALDDRGYFTTFSNPEVLFDTPGLNCSGLVVSVGRFLFNKNWKLAEITRDRQGNSGSDSAMGKDWDFGWDLIMNMSEGRRRTVVMPDQGRYSLEKADGSALRGFDLHDPDAWRRVMAKMRPGHVYLGSISKPANGGGYKLLHYHVVLVLPDGQGHIYLYHATHRSNVHKIDIAAPRGLGRLMSQFGNVRNQPKKILVVEAELPILSAVAETAADTQPPAGDQSATSGVPASPPGHSRDVGASETASGSEEVSTPQADSTGASTQKVELDKAAGPDLVINHLSGKAYKNIPDMVTHIPRFTDETKTGLKFWVRNRGNDEHELAIRLRGPDGESEYRSRIPGRTDLAVVYPQDFGKKATGPVGIGEYLQDVVVDGTRWSANLFEVARPVEAEPKVISVKAPSTVQSGQTFSVKIEAVNKGAESDYGGITVSCPDPSGLRLLAVKPGKVFSPGSTVLSVTSDKIRTKVPMAERWIELWGENKPYDMEVKIKAGRPGTYPLYVRCALRGVNVKSSVILMDPKTSPTVDQQGFPVTVHQITVR